MNVFPWGKRPACHSLAMFALATALLLTGCSVEDPLLATLRQRLVLATEPAPVTTIVEAKAAAAENPRVTFVGRITGNEHDVFVPRSASFVLTEIQPDADGHGGKDHPDNCPFCKRKEVNAPRAAVQFVDSSGEPLAVDARKLFGIQVGDTVVIRGQGEVLADLDMFQVTADGIYVRRTGGGR